MKNRWVFGKKKQKTLNVGKIRKYKVKVFFEEKTFSAFKIASLPNWEGAKYAGGSRPSCWVLGSIANTIIIKIVPFRKEVLTVEALWSESAVLDSNDTKIDKSTRKQTSQLRYKLVSFGDYGCLLNLKTANGFSSITVY